MVKTVLYSYRSCFSRENISKKVQFVSWYFPFYTLFFLSWATDVEKMVRWPAVNASIIMLILLVGSSACDNQLPDIFYYLPVTKEMRKQYLKYGFWIKIAVIMLLNLLTNFVLAVAGKMTFIDVIIMMLIVLTAAAPLATVDHMTGNGFLIWVHIAYIGSLMVYLSFMGERAAGSTAGNLEMTGFLVIAIIVFIINILWTKGRIRTQIEKCE